jgi:hypothetical protein
MENKKVTAVDWLVHQIENKNEKEFSSYYQEFIEQAKAKEKEQIIDAFDSGLAYDYDESETYYNKTYNK